MEKGHRWDRSGQLRKLIVALCLSMFQTKPADYPLRSGEVKESKMNQDLENHGKPLVLFTLTGLRRGSNWCFGHGEHNL